MMHLVAAIDISQPPLAMSVDYCAVPTMFSNDIQKMEVQPSVAEGPIPSVPIRALKVGAPSLDRRGYVPAAASFVGD